jgi:hypothetical protein
MEPPECLKDLTQPTPFLSWTAWPVPTAPHPVRGERESAKSEIVGSYLRRAPSLNGPLREPLFHPQVVSERFEQRAIGRRRLAGESQAPQESKPPERTRENLYATAPTIFVLKVPGPTIDPSVHARLDGGKTEGVRGRRQTEQILDQQQVRG